MTVTSTTINWRVTKCGCFWRVRSEPASGSGMNGGGSRARTPRSGGATCCGMGAAWSAARNVFGVTRSMAGSSASRRGWCSVVVGTKEPSRCSPILYERPRSIDMPRWSLKGQDNWVGFSGWRCGARRMSFGHGR